MSYQLYLDRFEKERLYRYFKRFMDPESCTSVLGEITTAKQSSPNCPHCQSTLVVRYGKYRGRQRYRCMECTRTFNDFTNTPLHRTHFPEKWIKFVECIIQGKTLQWTALNVGITYVTAFYWRHKLIKALQKLEGILGNDVPPNVYPFICVRQDPPCGQIKYEERIQFVQWISRFDWLARKYISRYVAWFHHVKEINDRYLTLKDITQLLVKSCSVSMDQTYRSIQIA